MSDFQSNPLPRRGFIHQTAVTVAASAGMSALPNQAVGEQPGGQPGSAMQVPQRPLGKTGAQISILSAGTARAPDALDRLLRFEYSRGVRSFDTAATYGTEGAFRKWFAAAPEVRKQIFLSTKDGVARPSEMLKRVDLRLEALGTDYIDLLYFHALSGKAVDYGLTGNEMDWPKSKEMAETIDALKKSGKVRYVGFASHDQRRAELLEAAADGGIIDVIMVAMNPWLPKDSRLNKAIDACHGKGIGLVAMKVLAGHLALSGFMTDLKHLRLDSPVLKQRELNAYQGVLHALWSDERVASVCVSMPNTEQVTQNTQAARQFKPLSLDEIRGLHAALGKAGPMMCAACDGGCALAAGTKARLNDLTRFLTYHEHHGAYRWAREAYALLTEEERNWHNADLAAARAACPTGLDFERLLPNVDQLLG